MARPYVMLGNKKMARLRRYVAICYKGSRSEEHDEEYGVDNVGDGSM